MASLQLIKSFNHTFFSRAANKAHGTRKITRRRNLITTYNSYTGSDGQRKEYKAYYYVDGLDLVPTFTKGSDLYVYLRRGADLVECQIDTSTGKLIGTATPAH